jgi:hypothetical protein
MCTILSYYHYMWSLSPNSVKHPPTQQCWSLAGFDRCLDCLSIGAKKNICQSIMPGLAVAIVRGQNSNHYRIRELGMIHTGLTLTSPSPLLREFYCLIHVTPEMFIYKIARKWEFFAGCSALGYFGPQNTVLIGISTFGHKFDLDRFGVLAI